MEFHQISNRPGWLRASRALSPLLHAGFAPKSPPRLRKRLRSGEEVGANSKRTPRVAEAAKKHNYGIMAIVALQNVNTSDYLTDGERVQRTGGHFAQKQTVENLSRLLRPQRLRQIHAAQSRGRDGFPDIRPRAP